MSWSDSHKRTGHCEVKVRYGINSLSPEQADAPRLAAILRGHWGIENRLHWVRDVLLAEDASRLRTGHAAQVVAVFRNVAVSLLGLLGFDSPSEGLRHFAWNPVEATRIVTKPIKLTARAILK